MQTNHRDPLHVMEEADRNRCAEDRVWSMVGTLYRWRKFIAAVTGGVAIAAVVISLMMPNWYAASARVLAPESSGSAGILSALTKDLPSAATAFLGGASGDYARYLTILSSRRTLESVVDSFNLVEVYETSESPTAREDAIGILSENVDFPVDAEYEFLSVVVQDTDPQRAADMANFFVRRLNEINAALASQNAGNYRRYVEKRYYEVVAASDSLLDATQAFQQEYGLFDIDVQTQGFFEQAAELRAGAIRAEIEYETLRRQLGPDNPQVQALASTAQIANRKYQEALAGQEALLPVARSEMSGVLRQYLELQREAMIQARILEVVRPMLEQARFDEQREVEAVQLVDPAVPPVKKVKPRRSIIVIAAMLSAFLLACFFVLLYEAWKRHHRYVALRLQEAAGERPPVRTPKVHS